MKNPLELTAWSRSLVSPISKEVFQAHLMQSVSMDDLEDFVSLWIAEGEAFCFQKMPAIYQKVRRFIAVGLRISSRNVGLCGSAKIGFSLSPLKNFSDFDPKKSDLDIFIVSEDIFSELCNDYIIGHQTCVARSNELSATALNYLDENDKTVTRSIKRNFIDINKIPHYKGIYTSSKVSICKICMKKLSELLSSSPIALALPKPPTLRVYKNWDAAITQNARSVKSLSHATTSA